MKRATKELLLMLLLMLLMLLMPLMLLMLSLMQMLIPHLLLVPLEQQCP